MKNKKYLLALLLLLLLTTGYSQVTFVKTYGTNTSLVLSNDMQPTLDGGYIMTGSNDGNSMGGMYLIKTDSSGVMEWSKHYGISGSEGGRSVKQTADSGYVITGFAPDFNDNMWVIKTNSTGNIMWSKTYGGNDSQEGETVISTSDGGYLVTGEDFDQYLKAFMVKTDSNGDTLWTRKGNHPNGFARAYSTIQTLEGDYVVTGYFNNGTSYNNYYLIKLDSNGDTLWSKIYDAGSTAQARCVKQLSDFGFIVAGKISGSAQDNIFLLRTDSIGNVTWAKTYGYIGDETAYDIKQTTDGGFILSGETTSFGSGLEDGYVIKLNGNGMVEWSRTYETPESDRISRILSAADGGYILDGYSAEWQDATSYGYFIKTDSTGNSGCNTTVVSTTSGTVNVTIGSGFNFISKGCAVTTPSVNSSAGLSFSTICTSVGIKELDNLIPGVSVESNPFSNQLKVNINDVKGNIFLYDIAGKLIMQQNALFMNTTLNTEKLTPGMYILKTATSSGFRSMKVVKQ